MPPSTPDTLRLVNAKFSSRFCPSLLPTLLLFTGLSGAVPARVSAQTVCARPVLHAAAANTPIDVVYVHAYLITGDALNTDAPECATAMAVAAGKVVATGGDAEVLAMKSASTKVVDLHGAFVMPGLNDAHVHLGEGGHLKLAVDLTGSKSLADMQERIGKAAASAAPGKWLAGGGWDHTLWDAKVLPTRADLDRITQDHPAIFERIDGHIAIANTAALAAAGITRATPDPQGGKIDRDASGEATGVLRETATEAVYAKIPPLGHDERRKGVELALADAVSHGLTSVQDNSAAEDFKMYEELEREGKLPLRITEWMPFDAPVAQLKQMQASHDLKDPMLHTGMLKGFMDGSLGSRTAAMKAPFADDAGNSGIPRYDARKLDEMAVERAQAGFQMGFHAIGDRAAGMALDAFAQSEEARMKMMSSLLPGLQKSVHATITVTDDPRYRVEHAQVVDPKDIERFAKLKVIASMQPNHLLTDMNWAEERLGPQRAKYSYAWKAFLDHGVVLAFGTDFPVEPITPFRGIYAAVTRMNEAGTKSYFPENKLTIGQALYAYTQGSAYAQREERTKGRLAPGYWADFVVLDRNLLTVDPPQILKTQVLETVVAGKTVYAAHPE